MIAIAILGVVLLGISTIAIVTSFVFEVVTGEKVWMASMKIAALGVAISSIILSVGIAL